MRTSPKKRTDKTSINKVIKVSKAEPIGLEGLQITKKVSGEDNQSLILAKKLWTFYSVVNSDDQLNEIRNKNQLHLYNDIQGGTGVSYRCTGSLNKRKCGFRMVLLRAHDGNDKLYVRGKHNHGILSSRDADYKEQKLNDLWETPRNQKATVLPWKLIFKSLAKNKLEDVCRLNNLVLKMKVEDSFFFTTPDEGNSENGVCKYRLLTVRNRDQTYNVFTNDTAFRTPDKLKNELYNGDAGKEKQTITHTHPMLQTRRTRRVRKLDFEDIVTSPIKKEHSAESEEQGNFSRSCSENATVEETRNQSVNSTISIDNPIESEKSIVGSSSNSTQSIRKVSSGSSQIGNAMEAMPWVSPGDVPKLPSYSNTISEVGTFALTTYINELRDVASELNLFMRVYDQNFTFKPKIRTEVRRSLSMSDIGDRIKMTTLVGSDTFETFWIKADPEQFLHAIRGKCSRFFISL